MPNKPYNTKNFRGIAEASHEIMEVVNWYRNYFIKGGRKDKVPSFIHAYKIAEQLQSAQQKVMQVASKLRKREKEMMLLMQSGYTPNNNIELHNWNLKEQKELRDYIYEIENILKLEEFSFLGDDVPKLPLLPSLSYLDED